MKEFVMHVERSIKDIVGYIGDEVGVTLVSNQWADARQTPHNRGRMKASGVLKLTKAGAVNNK